MTDHFLRPTDGCKNVLVVSGVRHGRSPGRTCPKCGSVWTVEVEDSRVHVWRNGKAEPSALLDASGHNVAVDCCPHPAVGTASR